MVFTPLDIPDAFVIALDRREDERGFFARTWCREEFATRGIAGMVQASVSYNRLAGTLRGMHFAWPPSREGKLVRCGRGRVHDVLVDLRPASLAFGRHLAVVLDEDVGNAIYIPPGIAHGFQTIADHSEIVYMMTEAYRPEFADGYRYDDPAFAIHWPAPVTSIADRDRNYPKFDAARHASRFALHQDRPESQQGRWHEPHERTSKS